LNFFRDKKTPALIAEIKHKSPSKGILSKQFDPVELARTYSLNGATAISILTDERYFGGNLKHLKMVRDSFPNVPLLRKDFICDPYQIYQARIYGADAILLIVAALLPDELFNLYKLTISLGLTPLMEVHSEDDLRVALEIDPTPTIIGINNRNLMNFDVDIFTTIRLRKLIPDNILVVSESGIHSEEDIQLLEENQINAILVGEALVTAKDIARQVRIFSRTDHIKVITP
jgi:indole-3-glycerol phosphate synthase